MLKTCDIMHIPHFGQFNIT